MQQEEVSMRVDESRFDWLEKRVFVLEEILSRVHERLFDEFSEEVLGGRDVPDRGSNRDGGLLVLRRREQCPSSR